MRTTVMGKLLFAAFGVALSTLGPALAATKTVDIHNFRYAPNPIRIHVGDRITFVNRDDEPHTVTAVDKTFDSQGLDTSGRWSHVFARAGTFVYFCELHPYMKATIVVLPLKK